jgi:AcrR family transcriptional regulator
MHATTSTSAPRLTAGERREHVLDAAMREFAVRGFEGSSTERIAAAAGISQPYLFRLFGTKKRLFLDVLDRCMADTLEMFREAAGDERGEAALEAIGTRYVEWITGEPLRLQCQLQAYAACDDAEVRAVVRRGFGRLVEHAELVSGLEPERISQFFAKGMLLNVITAMRLHTSKLDWAGRLVEGCTMAGEH